MAELGGYLAVSYLAEHVFTDAVESIWRTSWEEASGSVIWGADTPFGRLDASGGFSLDRPGLRFRGASNAAEVRVTGAGRFEVSLGGAAVGGVFIALDTTMFLPVTVTQENAINKAFVDLSGFTLEAAQLRLTWFDGPHHVDSEPAVLSPEARAALTKEVRERAARYLTFRLPTDKLWAAEMAVMTQGIPGSIIFTPMVKLGSVRILDGWFALGIDATSGIGQTNGNAASIGFPPDPPPPAEAPMPQDGPGNASLRLIVDPGLAQTYLQENAKFAVRFAAASRPSLHPNADGIVIELGNDAIVIRAGGTVDAPDPFPGTMPFTANVQIRPFIPKNTRTVYASIKPDVRVDAPWYLEVLGAIVDFFGGDSFGKLRRANKSQMAVLFGVQVSQSLPGVFGVSAGIEGRQLVVRPDLVGIYGEADVGTSFSEQSMDATPTVLNRVGIRSRSLQLRLMNERLCHDPTFRVRYRLTRASNGTEVASGTTWSGSDAPFGPEIDLWDPANVLETSYIADMVAERPPGTEVARIQQPIMVLDPFDRSHPFVRWRKQHYFTGGGGEPITILSAIHKTAIPGRCTFCDLREGRFATPYVYQALDTLPAPEEEGFSTRLCGYCFPEA